MTGRSVDELVATIRQPIEETQGFTADPDYWNDAIGALTELEQRVRLAEAASGIADAFEDQIKQIEDRLEALGLDRGDGWPDLLYAVEQRVRELERENERHVSGEYVQGLWRDRDSMRAQLLALNMKVTAYERAAALREAEGRDV